MKKSFIILAVIWISCLFIRCTPGPVKYTVTYKYMDKDGNPITEEDLVLIHKGEVHEYEIWDNIPRICPIPGNEKIFTGFKDHELAVAVGPFCEGLQVVDHGMAHGVGEGRLLPPEDLVG